MANTVKALETYTAAPLSVGPERDELFRRFQEEKAAQKAALEEIEKVRRHRYEELQERWRRKKQEIKRLPMLRKDRKPLWVELRRLEKLALTKIRYEAAEKRKKVRQERPFSSWNDFLKFQAKQGQETALEVLRSGYKAEKEATQKPQNASKGNQNLPIVAEMRGLFNHPDSPFRSYVEIK